ncbi:MAG: hypothetical protein HYV78_02030 [Candidatus Wildermuthbacteria bacterium]|nr:hypothetical protein [Candidatus Wildermuthbacteria bacterium]
MNKVNWNFIEHAARSGGLGHAYIFSGNDDEEKMRAVLMTASVLNCESGAQDGKPCGNCRVCKDIARTSHPDLIFVRPLKDEDGKEAKETSIGQMRELISRVSMGSWSSPYTVAVIEKAHKMNREAQSAFLKLLEEPKGNIVFFLLAPHADLLLPTIRSRAQELRWNSFQGQNEKPEKDAIAMIQTIHTNSLADRFLLAKKLADSPENMPAILEEWVRAARYLLLQELGKEDAHIQSSISYLKSFILLCEEIKTAVQQTSATPRLGMEYMMCALP